MLGSSGTNRPLQLGFRQQGNPEWPFSRAAEAAGYYLLTELQQSRAFPFLAVCL